MSLPVEKLDANCASPSPTLLTSYSSVDLGRCRQPCWSRRLLVVQRALWDLPPPGCTNSALAGACGDLLWPKPHPASRHDHPNNTPDLSRRAAWPPITLFSGSRAFLEEPQRGGFLSSFVHSMPRQGRPTMSGLQAIN